MHNQKLLIIKIGGNSIDNKFELAQFLETIATINTPFILVHGGGKLATDLAEKLNIPQQLIDGRRITDAETIKIATMVYAGYINKNIVALLQKNNKNSIGLSGADGNLIQTTKRVHPTIDYGFVGDLSEKSVNTAFIENLIDFGLTPVVNAITHDGKGQLLNTNADSIASNLATSLASKYDVSLLYCFEKKGVLSEPSNDDSVIKSLNHQQYEQLKNNGTISKGMLPKLENCFNALQNGVSAIGILKATNILGFLNNTNHEYTRIIQ